jgi:ABC-type Zn uptake system ZnuABC Zn-binding protein ZnuA
MILLVCLFSEIGETAQKLRVVTTTTDLKALVEEIGGDLVETASLVPGYQNPHAVEGKPSLILKLQQADLLVKVGLDLETWLPPLIDNARNPKIAPGAPGHLDASQGSEILEVPKERVDRSLGDIHLYGNPHYWLDPLNGKRMADSIAGRLKQLDPVHAARYEAARQVFHHRLDAAMKRWERALAPYRGAKIVTYHSSWPNFAKRFGLEVAGFIEPKPGIPPSPAHLQALIRQMKQERIRIVLMEPYFSDRIPRQVARETGAELVVLSPSVGGEAGVKGYLDLFDHHVKRLAAALERTR